MVSQRILFRAFLGRAAELDHLLARRRLTGDSHGGAVLIGGEAGIGKSRLVSEYRRRVEHSALFASSGCRAFAQRPLQPIAEVLSRLNGGASNPFHHLSASKSEQLAATVEAFDQIARRRTALIILEDLHWADVELVQTLAILADRAAQWRLLFVITYRDNEITPTSPIFAAFGNLIRVPSVSILRLEPLAARDLAELLDAATVDVAALPPRALSDVRRRSAGNPLFAEELLRHVVDQHRSGTTIRSDTVPISLETVIRERLEHCTPRDRAFLAAASVLGRRFRIDLLDEVFGFAIDEQLASLRRLRDLQLVDPAEGEPLEYAFRHALTRDVIYHEMLPVEAQRLHAKVGTAIAARSDADEHAEVIAHSFWEARLLERAAPYCEMAGEAAVRLHAHEDAATWYERAADAFAGCDADVARVLDKAVGALKWADAATDRALPLFERAVAMHRRRGDIDRAVQLSADMASALNNAGRSAEAVALLKATLEIVPAAADVAVRNGLLVRLAAFYGALNDAEETSRWIEEIDEGTLAAVGPVTAEYYFVKSWIAALRFELEPWSAHFMRSLKTLERSGASDHFKRTAHESVARQALDLGEIVTARKHALLSLDLARRTKVEEAYYLVLLAEIEVRAGNLEAARSLFRHLSPSSERLTRQGRTIVGTLLALALGDDNLLAQFVDLSEVEEAEHSGNPSAMARLASACARALLQLGRADEAAALLDRAVEAIRSPFGMAPEIAWMATLRPEWAERLRSVVAPGGGMPTDRVSAALCWLIDAIRARHGGDEAAARSAACEAALLFAAVGWPLLEAQCWEVAKEQRRALTVYRRTGSLADIRRLERKTFVSGDATTGCAVLTRRERELARLIAAGKDNRSAAEVLSISKKAVEKYLTSIYAKLGLSSRAQLAAFVAGGELDERS